MTQPPTSPLCIFCFDPVASVDKIQASNKTRELLTFLSKYISFPSITPEEVIARQSMCCENCFSLGDCIRQLTLQKELVKRQLIVKVKKFHDIVKTGENVRSSVRQFDAQYESNDLVSTPVSGLQNLRKELVPNSKKKVGSTLAHQEQNIVSSDHPPRKGVKKGASHSSTTPFNTDLVVPETCSQLIQNCSLCKAPFTSEKELSNHIKVEHMQTLAYQCGICKDQLKTLEGSKSHLYFAHGKKYETKKELLSKQLVSVSYMKNEQPVDGTPLEPKQNETCEGPSSAKRTIVFQESNRDGSNHQQHDAAMSTNERPSYHRVAAIKQKAGSHRKAGGLKKRKLTNSQRLESTQKDDEENEAEPGLVVTASGEKLYNVDRILRKSVSRGVVWYRIKWEGWDKKENTWERAENLATCAHLVKEFEESGNRKRMKKRRKTSRAKASSTKPLNQPSSSRAAEHHPPIVVETNAQDHPSNEENEAEELKQQINWIMNANQKMLFEFKGEEGHSFRRDWRNNEVPVSIVGSSIVNEALVYLVLIRNYDAGDPVIDPLHFGDCVMVAHHVLKRHFPEMLKQYFDDRLSPPPTGSGQAVISAAKKEILRRCVTMQ